MSSDIQDTLEKINRTLQLIVENSYLSRLDMMFSVLVTLTIFAIGLILNNISSIAGWPRALVISILVLMIYTLLGEFLAILKDDAVKRFAFWMSLVFGICMLGAVGPIFAILLFPPLLVPSVMFPFLFLPFFLWLVWNIDNAFTKYADQLSSRKFPLKAWASIWKPIGYGYLLFTTSFIANLLIFGFQIQ